MSMAYQTFKGLSSLTCPFKANIHRNELHIVIAMIIMSHDCYKAYAVFVVRMCSACL